ncbi:uncharacterized protein V1518DRAFT_421370 [Limtongia smithiae]|uniref:uncharacterized protein n=1 Tax=Limtongia smithiae TaxID=1125753 RepID=UPI0034CDC358
MKSRGVRPPDIVLPSQGMLLQQSDASTLASPRVLRTPLGPAAKIPSILTPRHLRSLPSLATGTPFVCSPATMSPDSSFAQPKRRKSGIPPVTPIRSNSVASLLNDVFTPVTTSPGIDPMARAFSDNCDTDSDVESSEPDTPESEHPAPWTAVQDRVLRRALDAHLCDPRTAPFVGSIPPPTLLHRIAKTALKIADRRNVNFNHTRHQIRKRIVCLSNDFASTPADTAMTDASLSTIGQGPISNLMAAPDRLAMTPSYFPFSVPLQSPFHEFAGVLLPPTGSDQGDRVMKKRKA